jgi:hypothetical protein
MPKPEIHTATVAELLSLSRSAHARYQAHLPHVEQGRHVPGDATLARDALRDAKRLREQADHADPAHRDPAWRQDQTPHEQLVAFYREQVGEG